MPIKKAIKLVNHALMQVEKEKLWDVYVQKTVYMNEENYISFEDYWKQTHIKMDKTPKEEILNMVDNIRRKKEIKNRQERR